MPFLSKAGSSAVAVKSTGGYLNPGRIPTGSSARFALLSDQPLEYWEVWLQDSEGKLNDRGKIISTPCRFTTEPTPEDIEAELGTQWVRRPNFNNDGPGPVLFNLAAPIYSYDNRCVQVFACDKASINRELDAISNMIEKGDDYESILDVVFVIDKEGSGLNTEYKVRIFPKKKKDEAAIEEAWETAQADGFDISRLLSGGNPFKES